MIGGGIFIQPIGGPEGGGGFVEAIIDYIITFRRRRR